MSANEIRSQKKIRLSQPHFYLCGMGVIIRQSFKRSLVHYLAVGIGALNMLFIYSRWTKEYGLAQTIIDDALMLAPFLLLGVNALPIRYFPRYSHDDKKRNAFYSLIFCGAILGSLVTLVVFFVFRHEFRDALVNADDDPLFRSYVFWSVPLAIVVALSSLLVNLTANLHRIVVPAILDQLIPKVGLGVIILAVFYFSWSHHTYMLAYVSIYTIILLGLLIYFWHQARPVWEPFWKYFTQTEYREFFNYMLIGIIGSIGVALAFRIDTFMVTKLMNNVQLTGVYKIITYFTTFIEIPYLSITMIAGPILSKAITNENYDEVRTIYQSASIILAVLGGWIFIGLLVNVRELFSLLPNSDEYQGAFIVVLFSGLARYINLLFSTDNEIIGYSKYFRFNFYMVIFLALSNVIFNFWLIQIYGFIGAALATFIAMAMFSLAKVLFIYYRFHVWPFTQATMYTLLLGVVVFFIVNALPVGGHNLIKIIIKSSLVTALFLGPIMYFGWAPQLNDLWEKLWRRIRPN